MFKKIEIIFFILILLFLVACNNEPATVIPDNSNEKENDIEVQSDEVEVEPKTNQEVEEEHSDLTLETMKEQEAGILLQDISSQLELEKINNDILHEERIGEIVGELGNTIANTDNPREVYDGIINLLGTPNYKELIERAEGFEAQFDEPYLPSIGSEQNVDIQSNRGKSIILLDANSTMLSPIDGRKQLDIVKDAITPFVEILGQSKEIVIVAYGHQSVLPESGTTASCESIEEIYPLETSDYENVEQALTTFEAFGESPLAGAIQRATEISGENEEVSLYIVSKEAETCGGDPVKEIETFKDGFPDRTVHIIGFQVEDDVDDQLKQLAFSGKGTYYSANKEEEIRAVIEDKWLKSFIDLVMTQTQAPGPWEILDEYNRFDVHLNRIRDVIKVEKERYDQAVQIMRIEDLVGSDVIDQVSNLINREYRKKLEIISDFRSEKLAEIDQTAENIRYRVEEWKKEMKE